VDAANSCVFLRAQALGVDGSTLLNDFNKLPEVLQRLEEIRATEAVMMGLVKGSDQVPRTIPKIGIVSSSTDHKVLSGNTVPADSVDLVVRFISDTQPHRAMPLTASLCTAVATKIQGTVVQQCLAHKLVDKDMITIGDILEGQVFYKEEEKE
jgi:2-methylaconitate cis-trans-isomerase PrpF